MGNDCRSKKQTNSKFNSSAIDSYNSHQLPLREKSRSEIIKKYKQGKCHQQIRGAESHAEQHTETSQAKGVAFPSRLSINGNDLQYPSNHNPKESGVRNSKEVSLHLQKEIDSPGESFHPRPEQNFWCHIMQSQSQDDTFSERNSLLLAPPKSYIVGLEVISEASLETSMKKTQLSKFDKPEVFDTYSQNYTSPFYLYNEVVKTQSLHQYGPSNATNFQWRIQI